MPPKPRLTQDAFDEAVKTNLEDFEMEPDEAVASAIEEYELQGYDLTGIIKTVQGGDISKHPIALATNSIQAAVDSAAAGSAGGVSLAEALEALAACFAGVDKEKRKEMYAVAVKAGTVSALLAVVKGVPGDAAAVTGSLAALRKLMANADLRAALLAADGCEALLAVLKAPGQGHEVATLAARTAAAAAKAEEDNKCQFMDIGFASELLAMVQGSALPLTFAAAACACFKAFTSADDIRPPASKAFLFARTLHKAHNSTEVLLSAVKRLTPADAASAPDILFAVRQLACNDEICKAYADGGIVGSVLSLVKGVPDNAAVAEAACAALRQLANSDGIKSMIAEAGGLDLIPAVCSSHAGSEDVVEAALGMLVNITLRMPDISAAAAEAGCMDAIVDAMAAQPASSAVQRQGCMAVRNMVVRNAELRPLFLEKGVEGLLRVAKRCHVRDCGDVGAAALRDLGLDNYNE